VYWNHSDEGSNPYGQEEGQNIRHYFAADSGKHEAVEVNDDELKIMSGSEMMEALEVMEEHRTIVTRRPQFQVESRKWEIDDSQPSVDLLKL
jgi:hypothetical protein